MLKKILIILYIVIIGIVIYFAYIFFASRDANETSSADRAKDRSKNISAQDEKNNTTNDLQENHNGEDKDDTEDNEALNIEESSPAAYAITTKDCTNACKDYSDDEKIYCQNFCGLTGTVTNENDCANLSGLAKDYCLRDEAVQNSDNNTCNQISDSGIKKQCINRVSEDLIDTIM